MNDLRPATPRAGYRLSVRKLAPAIGAEVLGVDLSQSVDDAMLREIEHAWHELRRARAYAQGLGRRQAAPRAHVRDQRKEGRRSVTYSGTGRSRSFPTSRSRPA